MGERVALFRAVCHDMPSQSYAVGDDLGDSSLVEFLRDISIIIAGGVITVWLLVLAIAAVVLYKKVSGALTAVKQTAKTAQEKTRAIGDELANANLGHNAAAVGVGIGKLGGFLLRSMVRWMKSTTRNKGASQNDKQQ